MPDFCQARRGVRQTVASAVPALLRLGVDQNRIVLASAGAGWHPGTIVTQSPAPRTTLGPQTRVVLGVAGTGAFESLPFPLRERSETEFVAERLFAVFDNPIKKLSYYLAEGGGYLELHPDDHAGALRWIEEVFKVSAKPFARERWYSVARLLPALPRLAGRGEGLTLALDLVFGIPARLTRVGTGVVPLADGAQTRLGTANGRLGVDAIAGAGVRAESVVEVLLGPMSVETFLANEGPDRWRERQAVYRLVLPSHLWNRVEERWEVGDRSAPPPLGDGDGGARLGINSYLASTRDGGAGDA